MPLRDHFRPPVDDAHSWEGFHGGWPMVIVQQLHKKLPPSYEAEPRVRSGTHVEIDVATYEKDHFPSHSSDEGNGGLAAAVGRRRNPVSPSKRTCPITTNTRCAFTM
jgi:hypothetical protein